VCTMQEKLSSSQEHDAPVLPKAEAHSAVLESPPQVGGGKPRKSRAGRIWLLLLIAVGIVTCYIWFRGNRVMGYVAASATSTHAGNRDAEGAGRPTPVVAVKVRRGNIGVYKSGLGEVTPIYTVVVKSRVDGQLMQVNFNEGDYVHQGDLLAEIDPRPFEVALEQAQGQLARDQALLHNALVDQKRYEGLLQQNAIPEQQVATQQALVEQYQGVVKTDQAQIDSAKLNLVYCEITAPITGRVGLRLVDPGNIIHASDANGLVVITQIQPMSVIFSISEDDLPAVLEKMRRGETLRAEAWDRDFKQKLATGVLKTVDNEIDPNTGTVKLRADFDNRDSALFPNQFVNVRLLVEEKHNVNLLNSAAVQMSSNSKYVYLVKPDSTVTVRQITQGVMEGDDTEVTSGLNLGDTVVMTGVDKLAEGSKVFAQISGENTGSSRGPGTQALSPAHNPPRPATHTSSPHFEGARRDRGGM
jgi:multidrug efflux system membrane fusion protein